MRMVTTIAQGEGMFEMLSLIGAILFFILVIVMVCGGGAYALAPGVCWLIDQIKKIIGRTP